MAAISKNSTGQFSGVPALHGIGKPKCAPLCDAAGMLGGASDVVLSDVSTWPGIPDTGTFMSWMPPNSSTGVARRV
jgi:hypothetical protein